MAMGDVQYVTVLLSQHFFHYEPMAKIIKPAKKYTLWTCGKKGIENRQEHLRRQLEPPNTEPRTSIHGLLIKIWTKHSFHRCTIEVSLTS